MESRRISDFYPDIKDIYTIYENGDIYSDEVHRMLKPAMGSAGYLRRALVRNNGTIYNATVHRLVLSCFKPIDNMDELEVNHIDGNKTNNVLSNLEWVTPKQNMEHTERMGLRNYAKGEKVGGSKIKDKDIPLIFEMSANGMTQQQIADKFGCTRSNIGYILRGVSRKGR